MCNFVKLGAYEVSANPFYTDSKVNTSGEQKQIIFKMQPRLRVNKKGKSLCLGNPEITIQQSPLKMTETNRKSLKDSYNSYVKMKSQNID